MIKTIKICGDPILREKSASVEKVDSYVRNLVADMFETMGSQRGVGLAAVQVGVPIRLFIVDTTRIGGNKLVLINPRIVRRDGTQLGPEGCLSIPGLEGPIERAHTIAYEATGLDGEPLTGEASELTARAIQHENDHLNGILFIDRLNAEDRQAIARDLKRLKKQWKRIERGEIAIEALLHDLNSTPEL